MPLPSPIMFRYLNQAFWARPQVWGLGRVPWNALLVAGAVLLGFGEHAVWLGGAALETAYLYALATNPRFQNWVDAVDVERIESEGDMSRQQIVSTLDGSQRQRVASLDERTRQIEKLYRESQHEDYLYDSNRDALRKLTALYVRLLVAQRNLRMLNVSSREAELRNQIKTIEGELAKGSMSETLRDSKRATLAILNQRLRNLGRREESLAEIDSDLTRIEQQVDLAAEDASLKGRPAAISANIDLVSHLLDDTYDPGLSTTTQPNRELEN
jgi:hypothetical protein